MTGSGIMWRAAVILLALAGVNLLMGSGLGLIFVLVMGSGILAALYQLLAAFGEFNGGDR